MLQGAFHSPTENVLIASGAKQSQTEAARLNQVASSVIASVARQSAHRKDKYGDQAHLASQEEFIGQMNMEQQIKKAFKSLSESEQGAISVLAIMVLLLLTIAGIASLYTARTEIQIAGNERDYVSALSASNAALNEVAQRLTHASRSGSLPDSGISWIDPGSLSNRESDMGTVIGGYTTVAAGTAPASAEAADTNIDSDAYYSAIYWGKARGSSLDITQTKPLLEYSLYGFYNRDLGSGSSVRSLVESGYRNR